MDDPLNPAKTYLDVAFPVNNANPDELRQLLSKYNQEAAVRIDPNGEVSFDILDESKLKRTEKGKVGFNSPHVGGIPVTYKEGDRVKTKDGREGTILGSDWVGDLVLYRYESEPRMGYFLVKVDFGGFAGQIKLEALLHVTNTANKRKLALIEVHNHAFGLNGVNFSETDYKGFKEFVPYVLDVLPGRPYAALVLTPENSIEGLLWEKSDRSEPITYVKIVGENFAKLVTTSGKHLHVNETDDKSIHARQVLAIGKGGQKKIGSTKVAIVGVGGLGSHVTQQLAYLGVKNFVIIEPDIVEDTNLNRLVGATQNDIGMPKADVITRMISNITSKKASTTILKKELRNTEVFQTLKQVDVIFGCVDNEGTRLILNEFAFSYLIHYIDCATGINVEDEKIESAGGRAMIIQPHGPCLKCADLLDLQEASDNLASKEEFENRKKLGYVKGADIPDPSVISLNGIIASIAVTEFIMLVTGLRLTKPLTMYDMMEGREPATVPRKIKIDEKCLHHTFVGKGDKIHLERYVINK